MPNIKVTYDAISRYEESCKQIKKKIQGAYEKAHLLDCKLGNGSLQMVYYGSAHESLKQYIEEIRDVHIDKLKSSMDLCIQYLECVKELTLKEDEELSKIFNPEDNGE